MEVTMQKPEPVTTTKYERRLDITDTFKGSLDECFKRTLEYVETVKKDNLTITSVMISVPWHKEHDNTGDEWEIAVRASSNATVGA